MFDPRFLEDEIRSLLGQNRKIEAIKLYKDRTGVSLMDAKRAVEAVQGGEALPWPGRGDAPAPMPDALQAELRELLRQGRTLEAVKLFKDRTGVRLSEAKRAVEALQQDASPPAASAAEAALVAELTPSLRMGEWREAVRLYQKRTGAPRRQARRAVRRIAQRHGLYDRQSACLSAAVLLLLLAAAAAVLGALIFMGS